MCQSYLNNRNSVTCACDRNWIFRTGTNIEDQYRQITYDYWRSLALLGLLPIGLEERRQKEKEKIISQKEDN